jgi:integrase
MRATSSSEAAWALVTRRLRIDARDLEAVAAQPLDWWREQARCDAMATTWLSALASAALGSSLRITRFEVTHQLRHERAVIARSAATATREALLGEHGRLCELVPYPASHEARLAVLTQLGPDAFVAPADRNRLIRLAAELAELPGQVVASTLLPPGLFEASDTDLVSAVIVARRAARSHDQVLASLPLEVIPAELRSWAAVLGMPFVRELCRSTRFTSTLCCALASTTRRRPSLAALRSAMHRADELANLAGDDEHDPLSGGAWLAGTISVTSDVIASFDDLLERRILLASVRAGRGRARGGAGGAGLAGVAGLRALLLCAEHLGARIEELPRRWSVVGRDSFVGVEDDEVVLSADKAASLAAFGHRLLRREAGRELSLAWSIAWSTGCRPRESLPCREDFVEVAGGYLVHVDRNTGKTGARELYLPRVAAEAFGIDPSAFADRGTRIELPDALLRRHVEQLEAGCRLVRGAWLDRYGETLPGRTSYFIRHAVADMLRERLGERFWLLAEVLGHASIVHDAPYTGITRTEHAELLATLADAFGAFR